MSIRLSKNLTKILWKS